MTRALGHSVRLAVVLGHVRVHEIDDVRADGHSEDGGQGGGLLRFALRRENGYYRTSRHGYFKGWGGEGLCLARIPRQDGRRDAQQPRREFPVGVFSDQEVGDIKL